MQTTISASSASPVHAFHFHGADLEVVVDGDDLWVSMRRICDALGVASQGQRAKLSASAWAKLTTMQIADATGRTQEAVMVHLDCLAMWLATIHASRVKPEIRPMLERFQLEAARVLRDHFFGKPAAAPEPAAAKSCAVAARAVAAGAATLAARPEPADVAHRTRGAASP